MEYLRVFFGQAVPGLLGLAQVSGQRYPSLVVRQIDIIVHAIQLFVECLATMLLKLFDSNVPVLTHLIHDLFLGRGISQQAFDHLTLSLGVLKFESCFLELTRALQMRN